MFATKNIFELLLLTIALSATLAEIAKSTKATRNSLSPTTIPSVKSTTRQPASKTTTRQPSVVPSAAPSPIILNEAYQSYERNRKKPTYRTTSPPTAGPAKVFVSYTSQLSIAGLSCSHLSSCGALCKGAITLTQSFITSQAPGSFTITRCSDTNFAGRVSAGKAALDPTANIIITVQGVLTLAVSNPQIDYNNAVNSMSASVSNGVFASVISIVSTTIGSGYTGALVLNGVAASQPVITPFTNYPTSAPVVSAAPFATAAPTVVLTSVPSKSPSQSPSQPPSQSPSQAPSDDPSQAPSQVPSEDSSQAPVFTSTERPTITPTESPTITPTESPTVTPTESPTVAPTESPTVAPTESPTVAPVTPAVAVAVKSTGKPSRAPTRQPSKAPTRKPSKAPTKATSKAPTTQPTVLKLAQVLAPVHKSNV